MKIGIVLNESNEVLYTLVPPAEDDLIVDCNEEDIILGVTKYIDGKLVNPSVEEIVRMREEEDRKRKEEAYSNRVEELIEKKYSLRQELAIQRQKEEKPEEVSRIL